MTANDIDASQSMVNCCPAPDDTDFDEPTLRLRIDELVLQLRMVLRRHRERAALADAQVAKVTAERNEAQADADGWKRDFDALSAAINDLYRIHSPRQIPTAPDGHAVCDVCDQGQPPARHVPWPCPTIRRLDEACAELGHGEVAPESPAIDDLKALEAL